MGQAQPKHEEIRTLSKSGLNVLYWKNKKDSVIFQIRATFLKIDKTKTNETLEYHEGHFEPSPYLRPDYVGPAYF